MIVPRRQLMPHQEQMAAYLQRHRHGALFCEMRTGKTLPIIRHLRGVRPIHAAGLRVLVLAPSSALPGWIDELRREGITSAEILRGTYGQRRAALDKPDLQWVLLNREAWRVLPEIAGLERCTCRTAATGDRGGTGGICRRCMSRGWIPPRSNPGLLWDAVIIDESHTIKNPRARITRFCLEHLASVASRRYALTGTPVTETPLDLWCQVAWLDGGHHAFDVSSWYSFRHRYFDPPMVLCGAWTMKPGVVEPLRRRLAERVCVISRRDAHMPEHVVRERRVLDFPEDVRAAYDAAEQEFLLSWDDHQLGSTCWATVRWQWMRQMCGGFVASTDATYYGTLRWDGKLRELEELLDGDLTGQSVVVWFAYNQEVHEFAGWRRDAVMVTGEVPTDVREDRIRAFQRQLPTARVLLAQQMCADVGVDLSVADTEVFYSRHASMVINRQSADRIIHPKKTWPMLQVDLVVRDTVDEDIIDGLELKNATAQTVIDQHLRERMLRRHHA